MTEFSSSHPLLSIILPTYNERENVLIFIPRLAQAFKNIRHEILVVDDSSTDGTIEAVKHLGQRLPQVRLMVREEKKGIGSALRAGYRASRGKIILSSDADLSFSVEDLMKLYRAIEEGADLAVGSRHTAYSRYEIPSFKIRLKYAASRWGNALLFSMFRIPVRDFSANCRAIRKAVWAGLNTQEDTNFFLFEMIFLAKERHARIAEIPVSFMDRKFGKSKINHIVEIPKAFYKMVLFILRRRFRPRRKE